MLRLLTIALPPYSFHLFSPLTVTFPKLSVILRPLYSDTGYIHCNTQCGEIMLTKVKIIFKLEEIKTQGDCQSILLGGRMYVCYFVSQPKKPCHPNMATTIILL
jgi:hypothetical protein